MNMLQQLSSSFDLGVMPSCQGNNIFSDQYINVFKISRRPRKPTAALQFLYTFLVYYKVSINIYYANRLIKSPQKFLCQHMTLNASRQIMLLSSVRINLTYPHAKFHYFLLWQRFFKINTQRKSSPFV